MDVESIVPLPDVAISNNITFELPISQVTLATQSTQSTQSTPSIQSSGSNYQSFRPIIENKERPVGNYYAEIKWPDFTNWQLVRFSTPMDGNCLFHAIANSFFAPYHNETLNGKHLSRNQIITMFRKELALKLDTRVSDDPNSPTYYDTLNDGNTQSFAEAVPEFALKYMQEQLASNNPIGFGYMEFIGNALNKDIYILEAQRKDLYCMPHELPLTIKGDRKSIVVYYMNGHYELVGIQKEDGVFDTHFSPDHSLIKFLYQRVQQIIARQKYVHATYFI